MGLIHSTSRLEVQVTTWVVSTALINSNPWRLAMEGRSRTSDETPEQRTVRRLNLWARLVEEIVSTWIVQKNQFLMLARAEMNTKANHASAMKQLVHPGHQVGSCLHPRSQIIHRSNQYAAWSVCGKCNAPTEVPVQEASNLHTKGEGGFDEGIRPTGANVSTSGEAFIHSKQGIPREFSPSERVGSNTPGSPAELSASELAVGSGDHAGELLAQGTFSGTVSK